MYSDLYVEALVSHVSVDLGAGVALSETQALEVNLHRFLNHCMQWLILLRQPLNTQVFIFHTLMSFN